MKEKSRFYDEVIELNFNCTVNAMWILVLVFLNDQADLLIILA